MYYKQFTFKFKLPLPDFLRKKHSATVRWFVRESSWAINDPNRGWGNGYIAVGEGHPLFGVNYTYSFDEDRVGLDQLFDVHGGLTYSEMEDDEWVFGFDTAHHCDNKVNWTEQKVKEETKRLYQQVLEYKYKDGK